MCSFGDYEHVFTVFGSFTYFINEKLNIFDLINCAERKRKREKERAIFRAMMRGDYFVICNCAFTSIKVIRITDFTKK